MRKFKIIIAVQILIYVAALVGEIKCIIKAVNCNWEPIGKAEVIYTAAACTGIGAVVGYISINDN